ncbi:hypothetical protein [Streptomyces sp. NPDC058701]|uniref:hypothetical protein n=1 Tax=Streptomyces sp. NPDC058701 TaxID=3346608 RepID=UPI003654C805
MRPYPPIAEHGPVGGLRTRARVSSGGVPTWYGAPRSDAPGIFAALLGDTRGGYGAATTEEPPGPYGEPAAAPGVVTLDRAAAAA